MLLIFRLFDVFAFVGFSTFWLLVVSVINETNSAYSFGQHWTVDIGVDDGWLCIQQGCPSNIAMFYQLLDADLLQDWDDR